MSEPVIVGFVVGVVSNLLSVMCAGWFALERITIQNKALREASLKSLNRAWVRESYIAECIDPLLDWLHQEILITGLWWKVVQHQNPNDLFNRHMIEAFADLARKSGFAIPHAPPIDLKGGFVGSFGGKEPGDFGINPIPRAAVTRLNRLATESHICNLINLLAITSFPTTLDDFNRNEETIEQVIKTLRATQQILINLEPLDQDPYELCTERTAHLFEAFEIEVASLWKVETTFDDCEETEQASVEIAPT